MIAALVMANLILAILAGCAWLAFYSALDQNRELLRERDQAEARAEAAEDELNRLRARGSVLLAGDGDPVYRDVARRLALVPEGGDESA